FFIAILIFRGTEGISFTRRLALRKGYFIAITLPLIIYLAAYYLWRKSHPSVYDGNSLDGFNIAEIFKVIFTYSINALPIDSLQFLTSSDQQQALARTAGWRTLASELEIGNLIKPIVSGFLFAALLT